MKSNIVFGQACQHLKDSLNLDAYGILPSVYKRFSDGEIFFQFHQNIEGQDITIIQSTSTPVNDHVIELLIMVNALRQGFARKIKVIMPYFGYARQDRMTVTGTAISAKVAANLIGHAGIDQLVTIDLHTPQLTGFFPIPVRHLSAISLFADHIKNRFSKEEAVIVSPDIGGLGRASQLHEQTSLPLALVDKKRIKPGVVEAGMVVGHVEGKKCILIDDIIDSGGTLMKAAERLLEAGAKEVHAYGTHGVFAGSIEQNMATGYLSSLTVTDSIHHPSMPNALGSLIHVVSIVPMIQDELF